MQRETERTSVRACGEGGGRRVRLSVVRSDLQLRGLVVGDGWAERGGGPQSNSSNSPVIVTPVIRQ